MQRHLVLALFALSLGPSPAVSQTPAMTLRDAIRRAAGYDPTVVQAVGALRTSKAGVQVARGAFLPSLTGSASGGADFSEGESRTDPITGELISGSSTSKSVSFGLNAGLDLFTGFRRTADLRAANADRRGAVAGLTVEQAQSTLRTTRQFYEALQQGQLIAVREASIQREEEKLRIAIARLSTRASTISDSLNAVVSLADARLQLLNQQARLAAAEATLGQMVGTEGRIRAIDDSAFYVFDVSIDTTAVLAEAGASAPAVVQAEAAANASRARLSGAKSGYWPTVSLSGRTSFSGSDRNDYTLFNQRSLSLSLSWPLFNRFQREQQISQRRATLETDLARAEDARRQVLSQLTTQLANLGAARQRISVTELGVDAARANVRVQLERYQLGSITIVELGNAQDALNRAEENAIGAQFDFLRARAEIEAILGHPL